MITLYTASAPNGRKASIALEELGLEYRVEALTLDGAQFEPEFLALNPNNKIPVIDDDGQVIWESGAILLHLAERYDGDGRILSKDARERMLAIQYSFFQAANLGPALGRLGQALRKEGEKNQEMIEIFSKEATRLLGALESILGDGRAFLAGPYSIADIMHYPWLSIVQNLKFPALMEREHVVAWIDRIGERPAVQRGMAVPK
ncbi:MAG: glutathione S-transferase family protein [Myxococcales bacterium]|nr:glutathione S-transferase family protein [Myxococcales bacterium]